MKSETLVFKSYNFLKYSKELEELKDPKKLFEDIFESKTINK